ncbi:NAD-dependent epimerase/dehydratase family protein [uncultured Friedmanniella sp.]|uniref:NAD-dependent epimerase/dehydratase family protein n=1 Tax=uncultured Friedmanniella sp. TaxID=335381 RepID=UPI0035CB079C
MSRLLITGGAGFIGSRLAAQAVEQGHDVVVLDDLSTGYEDNLHGLDVRVVEGSLLDADLLGNAMGGVDAVVHLAALGSVPRSIKDPLASHAANATGTLHLLEAVRRGKAPYVVSASSSSVYGLNVELPKRERSWVRPMSPYAVTKLAAEQYTLAYQQSFGLDTLAFRFFNVYGPGQRPGHVYAAVVPVFLDRLLRDLPVPVHGDGEQSRDFTFVDTVTSVLLDAVSRRVVHPEPVNLAFGTNTSINELVATVSTILGRPIAREQLPARPGDVRRSQADNAVLRSLFPGAAPTPLARGLTETLTWMRTMHVRG